VKTRCLLVALCLPCLACASGTPFESSYTLDFGTVEVATTVTRTLDLLNESGRTATIVAIDAPLDIEFIPEQPTPARVTPGATLSVPLSFRPFSIGAKHSELVLHTDSSDRPTINVTLRGAGGTPCLQLSTATLDFGNVVVNSSAVRTLGLLNCGDLDLDLTPSQIQGPGSPLFHFQALLPTLKAGQDAGLSVFYAPVAPAIQDTGYFVLSLTSVSTSRPSTIALEGSAVLSNLVVTPNPLQCGNSIPLGTAVQLSLHVANVANEVVTVSTVDLADPGSPPAFSLVSPSWPGGVLNPGKSVDLLVSFAPPAAGNYTGELDIRSNDVGGRVAVVLSCSGGT
jgi:hypothetical protein